MLSAPFKYGITAHYMLFITEFLKDLAKMAAAEVGVVVFLIGVCSAVMWQDYFVVISQKDLVPVIVRAIVIFDLIYCVYSSYQTLRARHPRRARRQGK